MLARIGPFLLVPFLVADWTDYQWPAAAGDQAAEVAARPAALPIALKWRHQIQRQIEGPLTMAAAPPGFTPTTHETWSESLSAATPTEPARPDPLYDLMSLQI